MNEEERKVIKDVLKEMKNAHGLIVVFLKGTAIELTLKSWIESLESLLRR